MRRTVNDLLPVNLMQEYCCPHSRLVTDCAAFTKTWLDLIFLCEDWNTPPACRLGGAAGNKMGAWARSGLKAWLYGLWLHLLHFWRRFRGQDSSSALLPSLVWQRNGLRKMWPSGRKHFSGVAG